MKTVRELQKIKAVLEGHRFCYCRKRIGSNGHGPSLKTQAESWLTFIETFHIAQWDMVVSWNNNITQSWI